MPIDTPNILLITSDQHHWAALGHMDSTVQTPNLDRLAQGGCVFNRAYCPNPTCTPSRASIITGQYPSQHGAWSLGTKLPEAALTIGDLLSRAGYRTALIGKAHFQPLKGDSVYPSLESYPVIKDVGFWREFSGSFYGFDHVELARNHADEAHVGQHYAAWMEDKGLANWRSYFQDETTNEKREWSWDLPEEYHYNAWIAERSNAFMELSVADKRPFFLWASFPDPHPPYLVPEPWDTMYDPTEMTVPRVSPGEHERNPIHFAMTQEASPDFGAWKEKDGNSMHGFGSHLRGEEEKARDLAIYYGMISMMDKYIGQILDRLDSLGIADSTLVVFTSDHGHFYGQHGLIAKGPFHYEDLIRVPLTVRLPDRIPAGAESESLQSLVDFAPTVLGFLGMEVPRRMSGLDQSSVWRGAKSAVRDHVIVENRHQPTTIHLKTYVNGRYKITVHYNRDYGELFDLESDPHELENLWNEPDKETLKTHLLLSLLHAEMGKEPLSMPRLAPA